MEVRAPRGFRDFLPAEATQREQLAYTIGQVFDKAGYGLIETPILEGLDVIQAGLDTTGDESFRFTDIDGRIVALRSDITVPIARMVATRFTEIPPPYRLRYHADVYAEQQQLKGKSRHRTQLGIELIGEQNAQADAEILELATAALVEAGLQIFEIHLTAEPTRLKEIRELTQDNPHIKEDDTIESAHKYYTGMRFDIYAPGIGQRLGGGGRYDNTLEQFGRDLPAAGFALDLDRIVEALNNNPTPTSKLRIAIPKATLFEGTLNALENAGLDISMLRNPKRQLYFETEDTIYVLAKSNDVAIYVATGAVDCGITGKDILLEEDYDVLELTNLKFGEVFFAVASTKDDTRTLQQRALDQGVIKVATSFPRITQRFFDEKGIQIELVKLNGSVEIAPLIGIADIIVDITETGTTLKENNLVVIDKILTSSAWFVANPASARLDPRIFELAEKLGQTIKP
jgi:ATP phosphoribosyltransferase